jgi:SAC3 domain-containing protein 1
MAVRQDMVVQNISKAESITILQPIVRFHAYAAYKLCHESVANFDPTLNNSHLQECLKRLLHFYDGCNNYLYTDINPTCNDYIVETRPEFEALYIIFNLGNDEPLRRVLSIPDKCKLDNAKFLFDFFKFIMYACRTELVKNALKLSLCYRCGNFTRLCRLIKNLPPLLRATASLHLPQVRR